MATIVEIDKRFYGPFPDDVAACKWLLHHPAKPVIAYTHQLREPIIVKESQHG